MIKVAIVDDEPLARTMVRKMLQDYKDFEVACECENGPEAITAIQSLRPDLVFLDVQMPEVDGFAVLKAIEPDELPLIIFVTAYDKYAVHAFEVYALDYLLKPFDRERFEQALERARNHILSNQGNNINERILNILTSKELQTHYLERLIIKSEGRVFFLKTEEIEWIEAEGNYVSLHFKKVGHLFRESITSLEIQLDPQRFRRIHRSAIVNVDFIKELHPWSRGSYKVIMRDGTELRLSHHYRGNFDKHFGGSL